MRAWGGFSRRSEREFASRPHPTATMQNIITLALAAGALASAMPEKIQTTFVDHYNDLRANRPYGGAIVAENRFPNGTQSVVPHTEPKFAKETTKLDFFQLGSTTFNSFIQLVRGPGVASFDLNSLYYALAVDDVSTATYAFAPESFNEAPFAYAQLPVDYTRLQNISIGVAVGFTATERTALVIDDVAHTNFI
ncbi:hypothetical protein CLAFUW4_05239 [Fulvia fulva]|uniref:Uncharacterized protein n=1 Tax=Passalora fulva TaxID=5499 RepID=A0A9Q8LIA4_PASFU|nr:uncharacterized protein CLAFUR5_05386 [Fulvia fulva]KAK4623698.1 hypothetical protein CLAFUR4_05233 [Fulvia fulva]KAK4625362.1 hypothetical protein CLAFUR0_05239 [Fulvia fulva]UJO17922.1 hypothetical protein CLAFUR5_05386 [Fulvia fulva]WPV14845.1 hypothetical protein CLAFUW4_05239 [Fulvia fulva]WPV30480.1 hypothetical protein CLAFUW7_05238 [Fulvia fulva]